MYLYSAHFRRTRKALRYGSHSFTCLYLVSVHQIAPVHTEEAHIIAASFIYHKMMKG